MLVVIIVKLFFQSPSLEKSEPTRHVAQVPTLVDTIFSHIVKQFLVLLFNDRRVFFNGWLSLT
jgi:hypothetical protein